VCENLITCDFDTQLLVKPTTFSTDLGGSKPTENGSCIDRPSCIAIFEFRGTTSTATTNVCEAYPLKKVSTVFDANADGSSFYDTAYSTTLVEWTDYLIDVGPGGSNTHGTWATDDADFLSVHPLNSKGEWHLKSVDVVDVGESNKTDVTFNLLFIIYVTDAPTPMPTPSPVPGPTPTPE
jgi:hypothetical protein